MQYAWNIRAICIKNYCILHTKSTDKAAYFTFKFSSIYTKNLPNIHAKFDLKCINFRCILQSVKTVGNRTADYDSMVIAITTSNCPVRNENSQTWTRKATLFAGFWVYMTVCWRHTLQKTKNHPLQVLRLVIRWFRITTRMCNAKKILTYNEKTVLKWNKNTWSSPSLPPLTSWISIKLLIQTFLYLQWPYRDTILKRVPIHEYAKRGRFSDSSPMLLYVLFHCTLWRQGVRSGLASW